MRLVKVHAPDPPAGSVEVRTSALLSTATQRESDGQVAAVSCTEPPPRLAGQAEAGPVGSVETIRLPSTLPLTQSAGEGQEMPNRLPGMPGNCTCCQAPGSGLVELRTSPASVGSGLMLSPSSPTATQNAGEGQEMPRSSSGPGSWVTVQADAPPVGLVEVATLPPPAAAAQNDGDGQETP